MRLFAKMSPWTAVLIALIPAALICVFVGDDLTIFGKAFFSFWAWWLSFMLMAFLGGHINANPWGGL